MSGLRAPLAGKFFWYWFIIFLTLNLMAAYGIMGVYVTPDLIVATVLSSFFYGFWCVSSAGSLGFRASGAGPLPDLPRYGISAW